MNRLNFNQSVGFPFETNILDDMQTSYSIFNALGTIVGDFAIIMGCDTVGTTITNGVVFINGELLEFRGGVAQSNVIIVEEKQALEFEDGNAHDVVSIRYATFGSATTQWAWSTFKKGFETKNIPDALLTKEDKTTVAALIGRIEVLERRPASNIPVGLIAIWDRPADQIPSGWAEYLPLKGRIPVGLDASDPSFDTVLGYGGSKDAVVVSHSHNLREDFNAVDKSGSSIEGSSVPIPRATGGDWRTGGGGGDPADAATQLSVVAQGVSGIDKNLQPYRVVHFIKYVG